MNPNAHNETIIIQSEIIDNVFFITLTPPHLYRSHQPGIAKRKKQVGATTDSCNSGKNFNGFTGDLS
jgi:hypothetical protein